MYEEIVKALRNCGFPYDVHYCRKCVCQLEHGGSCDCRRLFPRAADAIEELSGKVDGLQFFADNISKLPDCNTCMKKHTCEFMPEYGEYCRINCPAWLGEPEPPKEENE